MKGYIARDASGDLYFHETKPIKVEEWWENDGSLFKVTDDQFPQVKWEDEEPTEIELTIKICK